MEYLKPLGCTDKQIKQITNNPMFAEILQVYTPFLVKFKHKFYDIDLTKRSIKDLTYGLL